MWFGVALLVLVGWGAQEALALPAIGDRAPAFEVRQWLNGSGVKVGDTPGEVTAILFFTTQHPDLERFTPGLNKLVAAYAGSGLNVVGLTRDPVEQVEAYIASAKPEFPIAIDGGAWKKWNITGYPYGFVVDIYGEVAWHGDAFPLSGFTPPIEELLKEVLRLSVQEAETSAAFKRVWKEIAAGDYKSALQALTSIARKTKVQTDSEQAKSLMADIVAMADQRFARSKVLVERKDYLAAEAVLRTLERVYSATEAGKKAKALRKKWRRDKSIRAEMEAQLALREALDLVGEERYRQAGAKLKKAAEQWPETNAGARAKRLYDDLVAEGKIRL